MNTDDIPSVPDHRFFSVWVDGRVIRVTRRREEAERALERARGEFPHVPPERFCILREDD